LKEKKSVPSQNTQITSEITAEEKEDSEGQSEQNEN